MLLLVNKAYDVIQDSIQKSVPSQNTSKQRPSHAQNAKGPEFSNIVNHENVLYSSYAGTSHEVEELTRKWMSRARKDNRLRALLGLPYKKLPSSERIWIHVLEGISLDKQSNIHYHFKTKPMPGLNIIAIPDVRLKPDGSRTVLHSYNQGPSTRIHMSETEAKHFKENGLKISGKDQTPRVWFGKDPAQPLFLNQAIRYGMFKNIPLRREHEAFLFSAKYGWSPAWTRPITKPLFVFLSFFWILLSAMFKMTKTTLQVGFEALAKIPKTWRTLKNRITRTSK